VLINEVHPPCRVINPPWDLLLEIPPVQPLPVKSDENVTERQLFSQKIMLTENLDFGQQYPCPELKPGSHRTFTIISTGPRGHPRALEAPFRRISRLARGGKRIPCLHSRGFPRGWSRRAGVPNCSPHIPLNQGEGHGGSSVLLPPAVVSLPWPRQRLGYASRQPQLESGHQDDAPPVLLVVDLWRAVHRPRPITPHPHPSPRLQVADQGAPLGSALLFIWGMSGGGVIQDEPLPIPAGCPRLGLSATGGGRKRTRLWRIRTTTFVPISAARG